MNFHITDKLITPLRKLNTLSIDYKKSLTIILLLLGSQTVQAGFITTNEAAMDAIFSQTSFGTDTIDIRFNPDVTIQNTNLLTIDTEADLLNLFDLSPSSSPVVNMFFVDTLDWCGSFNTAIVGCASRPGNTMVLESDFAAGSNGAELNAHELGHNLGLSHVTFANLMTGFINGNTELIDTTANPQISTIMASPLVQSDADGLFISITPIAVVASVPVPGAFLLLGSCLVSLFWAGKRKSV